jgi:hypothetical protein
MEGAMGTQVQIERRDTAHPLAGRKSPVNRRLIVGHEDGGFISRVSHQFEQLGWDVYPASSPDMVRKLAGELPASVVILPTQFQEESGWLTCAKLVHEHPGHRVILVGDYCTPDLQRYTSFVGGSALLGLGNSMRSLVDEVHQAVQLPILN